MLVIDKPPFEIVETGWGEFEISIKIHFVDSSERPVDLFHGLVLYPSEGQASATTKKPVVRETVEELVFNEPTEYFYNILKSHEQPPKTKTLVPHPATESLAAIAAAAAPRSMLFVIYLFVVYLFVVLLFCFTFWQ